MNKEISILVPRLVPITTFEPYLRELYKREITVHAYGPFKVLGMLRQEVPSEKFLVLHYWGKIVNARRWQRLLHTLLIFALTPRDFSLFWLRYIDTSLSNYRGVKALILRLPLLFPERCSCLAPKTVLGGSCIV